MTDFTIDVHKAYWISDNDRLHWADKAKRTKHIRQLAHYTAKQQRLVLPTPVIVIAEIGFRTGGRADPGNASLAVKACLDGLTDAGAWPDDDSRHVLGPDYRRGPKAPDKDRYRIHLKFISQHVPF
ncbi:hypothetical protein [Brevibacterium linens]|uniref:Endodeoxyribonuclease RusA n=1 Tax=Brevibacterium linens TaxID=1703 RepID=A0A0B9AP25_BRELN|nr:hypothetical protein [Brevibacterium linens]KHS52577.1 endodeoxyribonuclease RusA [Brevibacterium linens]